MAKELSLEQSLQAYRVLNTPTHLSWKQHWVTQSFTHDNILECSDEERAQFVGRLQECPITIADNIKHTSGRVSNLSELVNLLVNPSNKGLKKLDRKVVYSTYTGERPVGEKAFEIWNGFQVIDMDIKDAVMAQSLKSHIFAKLHKCNWFLGVTLSASGMGLHIYTKIAIPEDMDDTQKRRLLYLTNFRHKYSFVYLACISTIQTLKITKEDILKWMDLAMFKPQQGAFIGYDSTPLINSHFFEDFIYVNFDNVEDIGSPEIDWVTYPDLKELFKRWDWFETSQDSLDIEVIEANALEFDTHNKIHYKHHERWRLANTLVRLYGLEDGFKYLRMICSNTIKDKELQADCVTAARYQKPVDEWAVNRLNTQHGFKIKLNIQDQNFDESQIISAMDRITNPTLIKESPNTKEYHIKANQYLGNIYKDLLNNLGRITLIEAGAGLGKTEMVKQIVREGKKVVMVMPFTSTIKSKVENDKDWYYSYGNRAPRLDVARGLAMTIDKFSHMTLADFKVEGFDYIFIDESHLLFLSEYRPVMAKVIELIRNTEVPIILMSGTPSGELVFFQDIVHLRVIKEELRKKDMHVCLVDSPGELMFHMARSMARDIAAGRKVLFPTNQGTLFSKQVKAAITYFLQQDHMWFDELNLQYYKKSNVGEKFMDDVNFEKTIKNVHVLMCTTYLSVGVDLLEKEDFTIYFADLFLPHETDQFANRLRSKDLHIKLFISKNDSEGNTRSLHRFKPLDFKLNDEEIKNVHAILRLCNAMIERNPVEYKYNSMIASIIHENNYIEYNELENKYFLNEIAYKVIQFERKYRNYAQQLPVLMKGMEAYGYQVSAQDLCGTQTEGTEAFHDLKTMVKIAYDEQLHLNTTHIEELLDIMTEDRLSIYKEVLRGKFEIRKGDVWKEDLSKSRMTVKNIEVFEKVVPIVISLSKRYTISDIREIFEYCRSESKYNFAAINRVRLLSTLLYNDQNERLDIPIKEYMQRAYIFSERGTVHKNEINKFNQEFALEYARRESSSTVLVDRAVLTLNQMNRTLEKLFKCLIKVSRPDRKGMVNMDRIELLWKTREEVVNESIEAASFEIESFFN